jgi:hypothetical protein
MSLDELAESGQEANYLLLESLILSDQVPDSALAVLMARHPRFTDWLRERATKRQEPGS